MNKENREETQRPFVSFMCKFEAQQVLQKNVAVLVFLHFFLHLTSYEPTSVSSGTLLHLRSPLKMSN